MGHFLPIRHCVWPKKALFCTESSKKCVNRDKSWYRDKKRMLGLLISSESKLFGEGPSCLRTTSAKFWRNCVIYNPFTIAFCKPICPNHNLFPKQLWWIETQPPPFDHWSAGCRASWWTEGDGGQIKPPVFDHWQRRGAAEVIRGRNLSWQIVRHCLRSPQWTYGRAGQIATVATYGPACKTATTVLMILVLTGKLMT